jgi:uncharacterized membrane protein
LSDTAPERDARTVQRVLQSGLALAVALLLLGLGLKLAAGDHRAPAVQLLEIFDAHLPLGDRVMALGALVLAATPVVRVLLLILLWVRERDWRFVAVAVAVLATLGLAVALGGG